MKHANRTPDKSRKRDPQKQAEPTNQGSAGDKRATITRRNVLTGTTAIGAAAAMQGSRPGALAAATAQQATTSTRRLQRNLSRASSSSISVTPPLIGNRLRRCERLRVHQIF
jgi:hypothetical protein